MITHIVSRDPRLQWLLESGKPVTFEIQNRLTGKTSRTYVFNP